MDLLDNKTVAEIDRELIVASEQLKITKAGSGRRTRSDAQGDSGWD
jgi:hypothetical protein